jgi:hypothetical protein
VSRRHQHGIVVGPGIRVIGWNAHRYQHSSRVVPPDVTLTLHHFAPTEDHLEFLEFSTDIRLSPARARELAVALVAAADAAESTPATDDNIVDPGVR